MKQDFDFHTHTNASDGSFSPTELIKRAKAEGIVTIAITDHDTVGGGEEAIEAGKAFGINVIPGVEISIDFSPGTMHLCGYFMDINNEEFQKRLRFVQKARLNRNPQIIKKLNDLGMDITLEEVTEEAGADQVGRPHFANVLLKKGYVKNTKEAFTRFLAKGASCYVDKKRLTKEQAINMIVNSGGLAAIAHPAQLKLNAEQEYRDLFKELKELGVAGIEAYSSHHSEGENSMFKRMADELDMLVTGGSDFHGETKPKVELGVFGENVQIDLEKLLSKMQKLKRQKEKDKTKT